MKVLLPTEVRNRWRRILRQLVENDEEILIRLKGDRNAVLLPADLYESLLATLDVLSDPEAMRAIRSSRSSKRKTYSLEEIDRLIGDRA